MPEIVPGYNTEQKTLTVANNDTDINAAITSEALDSWTVSSLILSGANMVILFTRTIPVVVP